MKNKDQLNQIMEYIENNEDLQDYLSGECDFDIEEHEQLIDDLEFLLECGESNYKLEPFACNGSGGVYALLDGEMVGLINSEGEAGIVAKNIRDFFSIIIHCCYLEDFGKFNWLDSFSEFTEHYQKCEDDFLKDFSEEFELENDSQKIYQMFRNGVMTQPKLLITATSDEYEDYQQIFEL
ncbi:MAG: hypothetical protein K6F71_04160 [Ruminococcus sp.]|uniref:hypothetical protein n=1 Tax=Ruminococcus sp. TaxID=41978 RepID=UPI0025DA7C9C|nr:hypothetical protein [Ruminococcus sp.]MCR5540014.1 hypothetical protein [Ruminococcus sp.]